MKKLLLSSLVVTSVFAFAHTQTDIDNAQYLANKNIITTQSTTSGYRLDDTITRAEVVGIALKVKGMVLPSYQCKGYFSDLRNNDWRCRAAELAADAGIVTRANANFRPQDKITRAEALAISMEASGNKVGMGGYAGYKYYFDANLYTEGGVGFRNAYSFGASWQAETFYQYIRTILKDDNSLKLNPQANDSASRAEVFEFAKNILGSKTIENFDEIKIENGNIVSYQNGVKTSLTNDTKKYPTTPCQVGETFISYSIIGQYGQVSIAKKSFGLCDADGGNEYLFIQNGILENLTSKVKSKFGITLGNITSVKITNQQIIVNGSFSNNTCTDSPECSPGFSTNYAGVKILSTPTNAGSGMYEWTGNISNF